MAGSVPIVGRSAERAAVSAAYARAAAGEPRVLLITGPAGIGKTRLAEELCQQAGAAGAQIRAGDSAPLAGAALAYGPFVAALGEQAAWLLDDDGPGGMLAARHRLFLRVLGLLGELTARAPLVLRLEDLHWADESSRELLAFLAVRLREVPVLLVATVREEDLDSGPRRWLAEIERCPRVSRSGPRVCRVLQRRQGDSGGRNRVRDEGRHDAHAPGLRRVRHRRSGDQRCRTALRRRLLACPGRMGPAAPVPPKPLASNGTLCRGRGAAKRELV